jgi:hypothetical protein
MDPHMQRLDYLTASQPLALRGPFGQNLILEGAGTKSLQWAPDDRRVEEIEFRAFIVDYGPDPGYPSSAPIVRWFLTYGHGQQTYQCPVVTPRSIGGGVNNFTRNVLPGRGLVLRMSARELEITFFSPGKVNGTGPWPNVNIAISMQPVFCSHVGLMPKQHYVADPTGAAINPYEPFPPEATEFRIFDRSGRPYIAGLGIIGFVELGGHVVSGADLNFYGSFQPIPVMAAAYGGPSPFPPELLNVEYR